MADGKMTASKPKSLLPMAWAVFVAVLAGLLLWLSGTAEDTVSDLYARADRESLRTGLELSARPDTADTMESTQATEAEPPTAADAEEPETPQADATEPEQADAGDQALSEQALSGEDAEPVTAESEQPTDAGEEPDAEIAVAESPDAAESAIQTVDEPVERLLEEFGTNEASEAVNALQAQGEAIGAEPTAEDVAENVAEDAAEDAAADVDAAAEEATAEADEAQLALVEPPAPEIAPELDTALPPWQAHSRPFEATDDSPRIAIVVTDLGLSAAATQLAIQDLPGEVTLAFAAHAPDLDTWIPQTRAAGHEALVMVPMEPEDYPVNDPGPYTLLTSQAPSTNIDRLDWSLRRATGFVGIIDTKGSRFTAVADAVQPVVEEIGNRGLLVLDSGNEASVMPAVARESQVPVTASDTFITDFASGNAIDLRLTELEAIARDNGSAVGVAFPYPILFERLKSWIEGLDDKGIVLAPITAVVDLPE
ncbi:MAG: divergent polysaccharide deacetylase family protein [Pseudomonadota bacterium]